MTLFQFRIENAFDTSNINKSNQIHDKNFNQLSGGGRIYDTHLFDTKRQLRHFLHQNDRSIYKTFRQRIVNDGKIHKKIY